MMLLTGSQFTVSGPGVGYISGQDQDGVTMDNVPARAQVIILRRSDLKLVGVQFSRDDGAFRFDGLPLDVEYDVIGRDPTNTWGDVIVSRVQPYAPPQISTASLNFTAGNPATTQMQSIYGGAVKTWTIDVLPPGLSMSPAGLWSGTGTPGSTNAVITLTDEFGQSASKAFTIVVS